MLADGRCGERGCSEVVTLQGRSEDATRANAAACTPAATGAGGDKRGASGGGESGGDERCAWRHTPNFARYSFMSASCATGEVSGGVPSPSDAAKRIFCSDLNGSSGFAARTSFSAATRCCLRASAYSTSAMYGFALARGSTRRRVYSYTHSTRVCQRPPPWRHPTYKHPLVANPTNLPCLA